IQPFNSMNNRYLPFPELTTDCVVSMDDDWDMPHDHITFAIQLWQAQFFNHIVGFKHLGRQHFRGRDGKWNYRKADDAVSIMLPSGAVYHRRFHSIYSYVLPASSRRTVDQLTNCDDILFNMMVANTTGNAPVVID
ncbi:exostosin, partial [Chytridium lagenaria]